MITPKVIDRFLPDTGAGQMRENNELKLVMIVSQSGLPAAVNIEYHQLIKWLQGAVYITINSLHLELA